jgi:cyclopropane fatty-acyl-phospholipid synthase-like methyltransferase
MHAEARELVERCAAGELSPAIALVRLLLLCGDAARARAALEARVHEGRDLGPAVAEMQEVLDAGGDLVLRILEHQRRSTGDDEIARCARLFDEALRESPEASVALYSLGSPARLEAATAEVVALLDRLGVLGPKRRILEIGCGIGRFQRALAGRAAALTGIDIAPGMIAEARRRCAGLSNVGLIRTSGRDLAAFEPATFDAVLAIDSLPYVHRVGVALLETHFREVARVLRRDGDFVILNLTYRDDLGLDREDARRFAGLGGFQVLRNGTRDLELWDGATFHLRKSESGA